MTARTKYFGLELPVYAPDTDVLWAKEDFRRMSREGQATMIRLVRLDGAGCDTLRLALKSADKQFRAVAHQCGIQVVRHEWGLFAPSEEFRTRVEEDRHSHQDDDSSAPLSPSLLEDTDTALLPSDYVLVADVDVVPYAQPLAVGERRRINRAAANYFGSRRSLRLYDFTPDQCVSGRFPGMDDSGSWLVDIEPMMSRVQAP